MYCVKFLDPLRGKGGIFAETTDSADVTDNASICALGYGGASGG